MTSKPWQNKLLAFLEMMDDPDLEMGYWLNIGQY